MARKKKTINPFPFSVDNQDNTLIHYQNILENIALSRFKWENLPSGCDARYLELALYGLGCAVFCYDDVLKDYLTLKVTLSGAFNVYGIPTTYVGWGDNGYNVNLSQDDSVIIFNNYTHHGIRNMIENYSVRLANLMKTIDINVYGQRTPFLFTCDEKQKLTVKNLYADYNEYAPVIFGYRDFDFSDNLKSIPTLSPYVSDKLYELKVNIWNEALTFLGISNISMNKKERLITDEVQRGMGGVISNRNSYLQSRQEACDKINKMFGLAIKVSFNDDVEKDASLLISRDLETKEVYEDE